MAVLIVTSKNMAAVKAMSPNLVPPLVRFMGLSNAHIHWKNNMMIIPRTIDQADGVSTRITHE